MLIFFFFMLFGMVLMKMIIYYMFFRFLFKGCFLIVIYKVRYYKRGDGLVLGLGFFVIVFEFVLDVKVEVVGKL